MEENLMFGQKKSAQKKPSEQNSEGFGAADGT